MILQLTKSQAALLQNEAHREFPVEACALLFGTLEPACAITCKVVIAPNRLESTTRFEIDPMLVYSEFKKAEAEELEFIGVFHSHYAPVVPSLFDLRFMKLWGPAIWLIFSTLEEKMAAFKKSDAKFEKVKIEVK